MYLRVRLQNTFPTHWRQTVKGGVSVTELAGQTSEYQVQRETLSQNTRGRATEEDTPWWFLGRFMQERVYKHTPKSDYLNPMSNVYILTLLRQVWKFGYTHATTPSNTGRLLVPHTWNVMLISWYSTVTFRFWHVLEAIPVFRSWACRCPIWQCKHWMFLC